MQGRRNWTDGLWDIELPLPPPTQTYHAIITKNQTKTELAQYLHACCFSPTPSTFLRAIRNSNFITWPGLTAKNIAKHLGPVITTAKGHLDQERKNLLSTTRVIFTENIQEINDEDFFPSQEDAPVTKTHECYALIMPFRSREVGYSDLTGRFPPKSSRGNQYLLVVHDYESNCILVEPLTNRNAGELKSGW